MVNIFIKANNIQIYKYNDNIVNIKIKYNEVYFDNNTNDIKKSIYIDITDIKIEQISFKNFKYDKYNYNFEGKLEIPQSKYIIKGSFEYRERKFLHIDIPYFNIKNNEICYLDEIQIDILQISDNYNLYTQDNFIFIKSPYSTKIKKIQSIQAAYNWFIPGKEYYKLAVYYDGLYKLDYTFLQKIGLHVTTTNPTNVKLYYKGKQIPLKFFGNNDDTFSQDEFFVFIGTRNYSGDNYRKEAEYGKPYNEYLNRYTDTSYYWLVYDPDNTSEKMNNSNQPSNYNFETDYYDALIHDEIDQWFDFPTDIQLRREFPEWIENKTWIYGWGAAPTLSINELVPNKTAKCYWKVLSRSATTIANAHQVGIKVNGSSYLTTAFFDRYKHKVVECEFNSNLLKNGANAFSLDVLNGTGIFHDWFELEYPKKLVLRDSVIFSFKSNFVPNQPYRIKINNPNNISNILIIKNNIKNKSVNYIQNFTIKQDTISFIDTLTENTNYFCYDVNKIKTPTFIYKKTFEKYLTQQKQANYILITHKNFLSSVQNYIQYINSNYKVNTLLVDVEEIYDYYNYGFFAPEPIKDFLKDVYDRFENPKPEYLFIVGDATYDYYNNRSKYGGAPKQTNWVPSYGAPVSDIWFVCWDTTGAYVPQMKVGRLPINSATELDNYLQRLKEYNKKQYDIWNKKIILFSGGNTTTGQYLEIKNVNEALINNLIKPNGIFYEHFFKTMNPPTNFGVNITQNYFEDVINNSALFLYYIGHSAVSTWDNGIFDITQLNSKKNLYPFIIDFGCSTGKFAEPDIISFSELATCKMNSKAIGYIGNSSLGYTTTAYNAPYLWFNNVINYPNSSIGQVHLKTKEDIVKIYSNSGSYLLYKLTNLLFADPIIEVKFPTKPNFALTQKDVVFSKANINANDDSIFIKVYFYNFGIINNDTLEIKVMHDSPGGLKTYYFNKPTPIKLDSLYIPLIVKNLPGIHTIEISINDNKKIDEILYDDNKARLSFIVNQTNLAIVPILQNKAISTNEVFILRPSTQNDIKYIEYADNPNFNNSIQVNIRMDTVLTKITFSQNLKNKRVWYRFINKNNEIVTVSSFFVGDYGLIYNDSLSFNELKLNNLIYNKILKLDTLKTKIELISGGYNDGNTAFILYNGTQMIAENSVRGHHVYLFDRQILKPIWGRRFDTFSSADLVAYQNFLDTLSNKFYFAVVIKDEGATNLNSNLRNSLKQFGSKYADNISFRSSWAMLGYKGAPIGSVPEIYKPQYSGIAMCDTTFKGIYENGSFKIDNIENIANTITIVDTDDYNNISYTLLLEKNSKVDTVKNINTATQGNKKVINLKNYNTQNYDKISVIGKIDKQSNDKLLGIKNIFISYDPKSELIVDDKSVVLEKDSVYQNKNLKADINIYNAGNSKVDSVEVLYYLKKSNNEYVKLSKKVIPTINANSFYSEKLTIQTSYLEGNNFLIVFVDSIYKYKEYYKFNNQVEKFFYVQKDTGKPVVSVKIDNNPSANFFVYNDGKMMKSYSGETFISSNPLIIVDLNDDLEVPLNDTSYITIKINGKKVNYYNNKNIKVEYNVKNPLMKVYFSPILQEGEYELTVSGKDFNGNYSEPVTKTFKVKNSLEIFDVYNYPNPFTDKTYFTFIVSQVPEEINLSIYTVAGRKIKEIKKNKNELNYDYNVIPWNCKDEDNNTIANGTYFYKLEVKGKDKKIVKIGKIAKVK